MTKIKDILHGIHLAGVDNAVMAIRYAWWRDRLDRKFAPKRKSEAPRMLGKLKSAENLAGGGIFHFDDAELRVRFLTPDFLFLGWDGAEMQPSYAVVQHQWPEVTVDMVRTGDGWRLRSPVVELQVESDAVLRLVTAQGKVIRRDLPIWRFEHGWLQQTQVPVDAPIYGLGERAGRLNLRPGSYRLWNSDPGGNYGPGDDPLYICMPVYICMQGLESHLVFYDNSCDGRVTLNERLEVRFEGGPARYYLAFGEPSTLLERLTALVGRQTLLPRWALGFQQSRWGYQTEEEMRRIYAGFREHDLPISALVLDADHMRGYRTLTTDIERYPNLPDFAAELREKDVHLVASVDPGIKLEPGFDLYESGLSQDAYCKLPNGKTLRGVVWPGWTVFPDFIAAHVRQWWGDQIQRQLRLGVDGLWQDMNEPANFVAWGDPSFPRCTLHDSNRGQISHVEAHNIYGLMMNLASYQGMQKARPGNRPFILSRSGWVGMQRHAIAWTGDIETSWEALRMTIATVLGLGLCGLPISGPDIGGFSGAPSMELFVRWFQMSAFLPFFRTHCAFFLPRREPWEFGKQALRILKEILEQRYRLLPFWYTQMWKAHQDGLPIVRPLFWANPRERELWEIDDAFLVGDALLVAPVLEEGKRKRSIFLPPGRWYEWRSERSYQGLQNVEVEAPLELIPVLVKAGTILPLFENDSLRLHCYAPNQGESGQGLLYSDAGDGYGPQRLDRFRLLQAETGLYQLHHQAQGEYPWSYKNVQLEYFGFNGGSIELGEGNWEELALAA